MRTLIVAFAIIATATSAQAYCYSVPDDASSSYVERGLDRTVCIQRQLERSTNDRAVQTQLDTAISKMQRDMQQQKFMLQQLQTYNPPGLGRPFLP
ncbi:hypothetical protein PRN20_02185 [Devosia sp. ZB163]|uniref:hypothetical protein n=1 Tax=Devosia sp. ZB163 TaxID=3025938 RepID=UPI00235FB613|nr:hypothetical protein [Devosia sp. ZB163]MDC9822529.1 hypothetical protein [Devosia sp. ZB163]